MVRNRYSPDDPVMKREALPAVAQAVEKFPDDDQIHNFAASFMRAVLRRRRGEGGTELEAESESDDESDCE